MSSPSRGVAILNGCAVCAVMRLKYLSHSFDFGVGVPVLNYSETLGRHLQVTSLD